MIISMLMKRFPLSKGELITYINTCPFRYKTYPVKKRNGGEPRMISQPSKDLKAVQRYVLENYLAPKLTIHSAATAYRSGYSIMDNARPHLENPYLLKMDFKDFFPSITGKDFIAYLTDQNIDVDEIEKDYLAKIFFKNDSGILKLSIGSPGSPAISNALMLKFDAEISNHCDTRQIAFSRYSDDLTFSTKNRGALFELPPLIESTLSRLPYPQIFLNHEKTVFSSKKFNRHVTGITITNDGKPSVGHAKKRSIRSQIYNSSSLDYEETIRLRGYISFFLQVEPETVGNLWKKYPAQMNRIMHVKDDAEKN